VFGVVFLLDSEAMTRVQSVVLVVIVAVAAVAGSVAYYRWAGSAPSIDTIKIGVCTDLDMLVGQDTYQGVVLAAEQINSEGGILGRQIEVVAEDSDAASPPGDTAVAIAALTRLITVHKVDFIISSDARYMLTYQDIAATNKKIIFATTTLQNELTERVADDYETYKYFFRTLPNATHALLGLSDCIATLRNYSGFNKVAFLVEDLPTWVGTMAALVDYLPTVYGFEIVYQNKFPSGTIDFSSYLSAVESSEAQILVPIISSQDGVILVKDWYDRQSPFVLWGFNVYVTDSEGWEQTQGKAEHTTNVGFATTAGYPLTNQTLLMRDAFTTRWGEFPSSSAAFAYDTLRFILYDAIKKAGTIEADAVIAALEKTKIETSLARNFVFTSNHDVLGGENINNPDEDLMVAMLFQWQNGTQVPMYPQKIKEEAGATYTYPDWSGPWDK
jgi:branched-chain amino acid transport system substrate-binding protein